jgi:hypothetical protein
MMTDPSSFRRERIEKLLYELRYEVERGMMERDIDETLTFDFSNGVVRCQFITRPIPRHMTYPGDLQPRLKIVKL